MTNAIVEFLELLNHQHQLLKKAIRRDRKVCWDGNTFDSLASVVPRLVVLWVSRGVISEAFDKAASEVRDAGPLAEKLHTALQKARDAHMGCFDAAYEAVEERQLSILMHAIDDVRQAMQKVLDLVPALAPAVEETAQPKEPTDERLEHAQATLDKVSALAGTDVTTTHVLFIAGDKTKNANEKMHKITLLDSRYLSHNSTKWGELLDVSSDAIRQTPCWKHMQTQRKKNDDEQQLYRPTTGL